MAEQGHIATVGMFDGVHPGHVFVLNGLKHIAAKNGLKPVVFTFSDHPLEIIAPDRAPRLLSTPDQRRSLIKTLTGISDVRVLDMTPDLLKLRGHQFLDRLHSDAGVEAFVMGFNNHIGSDRADAAYLAEGNMPIFSLQACESPLPLNSTAIRQAILEGNIHKAEQLLQHPWVYRGKVVEGKKLGRKIGFPTINLEPATPRLLPPPEGVYAVDATLADGRTFRGIANVGTRPTVDCCHTFEVHLLDFQGDLYGQPVDIRFLRFLRLTRRFNSLGELTDQLAADREAAKNL